MDIKNIKCSEIIDVRDGTHDSPKYQLEGYPLITSKNIKNNKIDFTNVNFISEEDYNKINMRSSVDNGDILMPMIRTVGNPVLVETTEKFAIKNVALFKLANNKKINNKYFYYLLNSNVVKQQLESNKRGGTQNFVSLNNIRELIIPLISIERQKYIATVLDKAQELIDKRKEQIEALDELVKSKFIEMFGNLHINDMEWKEYTISDYCEVKGGKRVPKGEKLFDKTVINKVYLAYYLNSDVGQKYILERKMIVGVPKLAIFRIESLPLILPPIELQNQFADFVNQVDKLKFEMQKSLEEMENNFNSLMQRAFKGKLFN